MAYDTSVRDIARAVGKLTDELHQTNRCLKGIAETLKDKEFADMLPPPKGTAIINMNGLVCMDRADYDRIKGEQ